MSRESALLSSSSTLSLSLSRRYHHDDTNGPRGLCRDPETLTGSRDADRVRLWFMRGCECIRNCKSTHLEIGRAKTHTYTLILIFCLELVLSTMSDRTQVRHIGLPFTDDTLDTSSDTRRLSSPDTDRRPARVPGNLDPCPNAIQPTPFPFPATP